MGRRQLIIEVDEREYEKLKKKIKKTTFWLDGSIRHGDGICLANDPEYQDDIYCIDATIILEFDEASKIV